MIFFTFVLGEALEFSFSVALARRNALLTGIAHLDILLAEHHAFHDGAAVV